MKNKRILKLIGAGALLIALAYGVLYDGFSKGRAIFREECDLKGTDTQGWTRVGRPVSFLIPSDFKTEKGRNRWVEKERSIEAAWFERTGNASPNMKKACRLNGRTAVLDHEAKNGQIWYSLEFIDAPSDLSGPPSYHVIIAHGRETDDVLLSGILRTARLEE